MAGSVLTECSTKKTELYCDLRDVINVGDTSVVEQWGKSVISYSSQYDNQGWSAQKILGKPAVFPRYGDIRGSWAQGVCDAAQFIAIRYEKALYLDRLDIYETLNGGAVVCIKVESPHGQWVTVFSGPAIVHQESRIFTPVIQMPNFPLKSIRLELDCTAAGTWCEIDAVKMVGRINKISPPPPLTNLSHQLYALVNNSEFSDITFSVDGSLIYAHRAILSARSDYFRAMFDSGMKESSSQKQAIDVPEVSREAFLGLLQYLYTHTLASNIKSLTMLELMRVGDRFSADGLDELCYWYLSQDLTNDNVIPVYRSAAEGLPVQDNVRELCLNYMADHMADVARSDEFSKLPQPLMLEIIQYSASQLKI